MIRRGTYRYDTRLGPVPLSVRDLTRDVLDAICDATDAAGVLLSRLHSVTLDASGRAVLLEVTPNPYRTNPDGTVAWERITP